MIYAVQVGAHVVYVFMIAINAPKNFWTLQAMDQSTGNPGASRTSSYSAATGSWATAAVHPALPDEERPHEDTAVDMTLHRGLRGVLASYIALFHCVVFSKLQVDICGSAIMSFFFLLSGFACAVAHTPKALASGESEC